MACFHWTAVDAVVSEAKRERETKVNATRAIPNEVGARIVGRFSGFRVASQDEVDI